MILEVESKLAPGEIVKVLAVYLMDLDTKQNVLVPLARLFEEHPMDICYAPKPDGEKNAKVVNILNDIYGTLKGWEMP